MGLGVVAQTGFFFVICVFKQQDHTGTIQQGVDRRKEVNI